jgi:hypothetical protein
MDTDPVLYSDDPKDMCILMCDICRDGVKCLRMHVRSQHNITIADYRKSYPEVSYVRKTYHR